MALRARALLVLAVVHAHGEADEAGSCGFGKDQENEIDSSFALNLLQTGSELHERNDAADGNVFMIPKHEIGNWEARASYLREWEYVPPGGKKSDAILNTCRPGIPYALRCTGHGQCRDWDDSSGQSSQVMFCECDRYWADPNCGTPRQSQVTAFLFSIFLGTFGADQFYLGFWWLGVLKLLTFGGCGIWYVFDICRIGSSAVMTRNHFQVAADLSHFAFLLSIVTLSLLIGFVIGLCAIRRHRSKAGHDIMLLRGPEPKEEEEEYEEVIAVKAMKKKKKDERSSRMPLQSQSFSGYGATLPPMTVPQMPHLMPMTLPPRPLSTTTVAPPPATIFTTPPPSHSPAPLVRSPSTVVTLPKRTTIVTPPASSIDTTPAPAAASEVLPTNGRPGSETFLPAPSALFSGSATLSPGVRSNVQPQSMTFTPGTVRAVAII